MKLLSKKITVCIISIAVLISISVGVTIAYLVSRPDPLDNRFKPVSVACIVEDGDAGAGISNLAVKNTGDVKAYARCVVLATYVSTSDGTIHSDAPIKGEDFNLNMGSDSWMLSDDGFYYYALPVEPNSSTDVLVSSVTEIASAPSGYELRISVYASMLQSEPAKAIEQTWNVTILNNGNLYLG